MDICYPAGTDWSSSHSAVDIEALRASAETGPRIEIAEMMAWTWLASLTAYRIATCPVTVRPCAARCGPSGSYRTAVVSGGSAGAVGSGGPYITGGRWMNSFCGCRTSCYCTALPTVNLPGPVGAIESVYLDGELVPRSAYKVMNGTKLIRTDGGSWPACQDMALSDQEGFSVRYYRGAAPNRLTLYVAGVLANEFLLGMNGDSACRLPSNVTAASRNGESYEFEVPDHAEGKTGIPEVDRLVELYNPNHLKSPVIIASPDAYETPVRTW